MRQELIDICVHTETQIKGFFGDYRWLSNYHVCEIEYEGLIYPSSENAYQAAKSTDSFVRSQFQNITPSQAKSLGKKITMRRDWDSVKIDIMTKILRCKFSHEDLRELLASTGEKYIEETNYWDDTFYGVCDGKGKNHLGEILMKIRKEIE